MQYCGKKFPFSMRSLINKFHTRMCFVHFVLDSFPFFSMRISLMLSCWNSSSSTVYPYPSIQYLDYRHCDTASYDPPILASVELLTFSFFFHDVSIMDPDPIDIIAPVCPLHFVCAEKYGFTRHLMALMM